MKLEEVLPGMRQGRNIRRKAWIEDAKYPVFRHLGFSIDLDEVCIIDIDDKTYPLCEKDFFADDWEFITKKVKKYPALIFVKNIMRVTTSDMCFRTIEDAQQALKGYADVIRLVTNVPDLIEYDEEDEE